MYLLDSLRLKALLDYVDLHIGLGAQPIALRTSLVSKHLDVVSFLRQYVQAKKMEEGTRVSYFSIRLAVGPMHQPLATPLLFPLKAFTACDRRNALV